MKNFLSPLNIVKKDNYIGKFEIYGAFPPIDEIIDMGEY